MSKSKDKRRDEQALRILEAEKIIIKAYFKAQQIEGITFTEFLQARLNIHHRYMYTVLDAELETQEHEFQNIEPIK